MVIIEFDENGEIVVSELMEITEQCEWMIEVEENFKK